MQRFAPDGPSKSTMRYEVYRNKNSSDEDFEVIAAMYRRIMSEDKDLCARAQKNINAGIFINGEMHPKLEKGPLYFQNLVREAVQTHYKRESDAERELWPARQTLPRAAAAANSDVEFCASLCPAADQCSVNKEALAF